MHLDSLHELVHSQSLTKVCYKSGLPSLYQMEGMLEIPQMLAAK